MEEKKESWIEKLVELLNEYEIQKNWEERRSLNSEWWLCCADTPCWQNMYWVLICAKPYGFIKWLVKNDKIETNNLSLKAFKNIFSGGWFVEISDLEVLLMLLSISDTPIDDLILYLK